MEFKLISKFKPTGDQPQAIKKLTENIKNDYNNQVLLGVTGSGKTFTIANVIKNIQKPTLIISHNKTLAAQLYQEFRDFFPKNAVSYFVSYYDYYQPEAYIPQTDTYIQKEVEINEEIDKLRLSATTNLLTRKDVIVVASVSCIYNIGSPVEYGKFAMELQKGVKVDQKSILIRLADLQYERNDYGFNRGTYRVRGESIDLFPAYSNNAIRIDLKNGYIEKLQKIDPLTGDVINTLSFTVIYPSKHYMTTPESYDEVFTEIRNDLNIRVKELKSNGKLVEAQRIKQRVEYDLKMIKEVGYVNGIENYSRYFDNRKPGDPPYTLLDYFKTCSKDFLTVIDESHITLPQLRGMYNGDKARKQMLIDYGFRLKSALDNRPLRFEEFKNRIGQAIFSSATPDNYELSISGKNGIAEQLIRPTGLVDPKISVRQTKNQIEDLIIEIKKRVKRNERILVTTLTKRMAEDLSSFLREKEINISYLHSDIETLERQDVLDKLRSKEYDVLVGINLLREGLDLPEVSLVVILDADKEGFLRSQSSLIQIMGRAARNVNSEVIMYADNITKSMENAISEVERRRKIQLKYNKIHNITPKTITKEIKNKLVEGGNFKKTSIQDLMPLINKEVLLPDEKEKIIKELLKQMKNAAKELDFETAVILRDQIRKLKSQ